MRNRSDAIWGFAISWRGAYDEAAIRFWSMCSWSMPKAARMFARTGSRPIAETSRKLRARSPAVLRERLMWHSCAIQDAGSSWRKRSIPTRAISSCADGLGITGQFPQPACKRLFGISSARSRTTRDPSMRGSALHPCCLAASPSDGAALRNKIEHGPNSCSSKLSSAMGIVRRMQVRLSESKMEFETAIALDRNNARAIFQLGQTMMWLGQPEAGIPLLERAIRLNPHDPTLASHYAALGSCHLLLGRVDQAIDLLRKARSANPRLYYVHLFLAGALGLKGDLDEARAALAESLRLKPEINSFAAQRANVPYHAN